MHKQLLVEQGFFGGLHLRHVADNGYTFFSGQRQQAGFKHAQAGFIAVTQTIFKLLHALRALHGNQRFQVLARHAGRKQAGQAHVVALRHRVMHGIGLIERGHHAIGKIDTPDQIGQRFGNGQIAQIFFNTMGITGGGEGGVSRSGVDDGQPQGTNDQPGANQKQRQTHGHAAPPMHSRNTAQAHAERRTNQHGSEAG